jgi:hypothetical protein
MIPKVVHQTWKTRAIPPRWARLTRSWKRHHPDWEHRLWTDADNRRLVASEYPAFLPVYDSYPLAIQRADVARYCLLHRFGGIYVDMDVECLRPFDALLSPHAAVLAREPPLSGQTEHGRPLISNAFMAARPGHAFFEAVLRHLQARAHPKILDWDVVATTGARMLARVLGHLGDLDVHVLHRRVISPLDPGSRQLLAIQSGTADALKLKLSCIQDGAFAIHYWANSWIGRPAPGSADVGPVEVEGFQFFSRMESTGFSIGHSLQGVTELAATCLDVPGVAAFNTDGFIKSRVRPKWSWVHAPERPANEGLYVKRSILSRPWWAILGAGPARFVEE